MRVQISSVSTVSFAQQRTPRVGLYMSECLPRVIVARSDTRYEFSWPGFKKRLEPLIAGPPSLLPLRDIYIFRLLRFIRITLSQMRVQRTSVFSRSPGSTPGASLTFWYMDLCVSHYYGETPFLPNNPPTIRFSIWIFSISHYNY